MSRKPPIPMAPLLPTTQQAIWGRSSWELPQARSLPMAVATGGRRIVAGVTTIRTRRRIVVLTTVTVIITGRLTTITIRELTAGMGALTVPMDRRVGELVIIRTQARTLEAGRFPRLTAAEVQHRLTIRTP